jgi:hypothetical protein
VAAPLPLLGRSEDHEQRDEEENSGTDEVHGGDTNRGIRRCSDPIPYCLATETDPRAVRAKEKVMIRALIAAIVVLLVATFPATWMLMLFLGNIGTNLSYWGTLPMGILVSALLSGAVGSSYRTN